FKILLLVILIIFAPIVVWFHWHFQSALAGILCSLSIFAVGLNNIAVQDLIRRGLYGKYSVQIFLSLGLPPLLQMGFMNVPQLGLILGSFSAYSVGAIVATSTIYKNLEFSLALTGREKA